MKDTFFSVSKSYENMECVDIVRDIAKEYYGIDNIDEVPLFAMNSRMHHRLMVLHNKNKAHRKRLKRRRKIERRQNRVAFRRRKQGLA